MDGANVPPRHVGVNRHRPKHLIQTRNSQEKQLSAATRHRAPQEQLREMFTFGDDICAPKVNIRTTFFFIFFFVVYYLHCEADLSFRELA